MALNFRITDGTDTVDFVSGDGLALSDSFQMNVGDGVVAEKVICGWQLATDTDAKAVVTKKFNRLIRKAIAHYRERRIDRAVWLIWKPFDQTDTQYAKVMGGGEVEIPSLTIGDSIGGIFAPDILREGAWRSVAPDGTAGTSVVSAQTIYNKSDADGDNWVDIATTRTNDAPGMLHITQDSAPVSDYIIAMKRGTTTELNKFNPHFNPTDQSSAHGETSDTIAPGNFRIDITASNTITWTIDGDNLAAYAGNYLVYAVNYQSSGAGSATARFTSTYVSGDYYDVGASVSDDLLYLGVVSFPGVEMNPFVTPAAGDDISIGIQYIVSGTATVGFFGFFLVPIDISVLKLEATGTLTGSNEVVCDGVTETAYTVNSSGQSTYTDGLVSALGQFPTTRGGTVNRLFFYQWNDTNYGHNTSTVVDVRIVDRFIGLRGNT